MTLRWVVLVGAVLTVACEVRAPSPSTGVETSGAWSVGPVGSMDEQLQRWAALDPTLSSSLSLHEIGPHQVRLVAWRQPTRAASALGERATPIQGVTPSSAIPIRWVTSDVQRAIVTSSGRHIASLSPGTPFVVASGELGHLTMVPAWSALGSGLVAAAVRPVSGCVPRFPTHPSEWLAVPAGDRVLFARSHQDQTEVRVHSYRAQGCEVGGLEEALTTRGRLRRADLTRTAERGGTPVTVLVLTGSDEPRRVEVHTLGFEHLYRRTLPSALPANVVLETARRVDGDWIAVAVRDDPNQHPVVLRWDGVEWHEGERRRLPVAVP